MYIVCYGASFHQLTVRVMSKCALDVDVALNSKAVKRSVVEAGTHGRAVAVIVVLLQEDEHRRWWSIGDYHLKHLYWFCSLYMYRFTWTIIVGLHCCPSSAIPVFPFVIINDNSD